MTGAIELQNEQGELVTLYRPTPKQQAFHASTAPNLLALGTRGTGKSLMVRMDAHMRCLMVPGFKALIVRRTMPELRKSHLGDIGREMKALGGIYLGSTFQAKYPNDSVLTFAHCETEADILNFLSSEYGAIYFDELSTFTLTQFLQISAAARAPIEAPYTAVVRAASNPLGIGAEWMKQWFVDKNVRYEDFPDYNPADFEMQFSTLEDNPHLDRKAYEARLRTLPEHVRRAWLLGEFVIEGAYFLDFRPSKLMNGDICPWHVLEQIPMWQGRSLFQQPWLTIYRAVDWGYHPDPAVCLWIAVLPNKRAIVFKERQWKQTLAADVAREIVRESAGMQVAETFCDPTMLIKIGEQYSIGELFEYNGVPLTAGINDRALYGYSIHNYLNTLIDEQPQLQLMRPIGGYGCPELIRTFPLMRTDKLHPDRIADGDDHWVVALAHFCTGMAEPSKQAAAEPIRRWMLPKPTKKGLRAWLP